jgi:hypothetical protein
MKELFDLTTYLYSVINGEFEKISDNEKKKE